MTKKVRQKFLEMKWKTRNSKSTTKRVVENFQEMIKKFGGQIFFRFCAVVNFP